MYSKKQVADTHEKFWTAFGQYMQPIPSASGEKVHWVNYKTGVRHVRFKAEAGRDQATVGIYIDFAEDDARMKMFQRFVLLKEPFEEMVGTDWHWSASLKANDNRVFSCICSHLVDFDVMKESDWPAIIAFLKKQLITLDAFWVGYKEVFESSLND